MSIRVHRKPFLAMKLLAYPRGLTLSRKIRFFGTSCGLFMRMHFSIGCYDCRRTSRHRQRIHFSRIQVFLLIICIDALESTTNSRSPGLRFDGASRHQFSEGEKNALLFFSFNFRTFWASFHAASRAHRSCHSVSSSDRSSNFEHWGYADEVHLGKNIRAKDSGLEF